MKRYKNPYEDTPINLEKTLFKEMDQGMRSIDAVSSEGIKNSENNARSTEIEMFEAAMEELFNDIKNNTIRVREPSFWQKIKIRKQWEKNKPIKSFFVSRDDLYLENIKIPAEVYWWVDRVIAVYFEDKYPSEGYLGKCHAIDGARKALFEYRGYEWYSTRELCPEIKFD